MEFVDNSGARYQLTESAEAPAPPKKTPVWPWVVGGLAVAGGLVWMASASTRKTNPVDNSTNSPVEEARNPDTSREHLVELAEHPEVEVRRALLDNPKVCLIDEDGDLDTRLLEKLAQEFPEEVAVHPLFVLYALIEPHVEMRWVVMDMIANTKDVGLIDQWLRRSGGTDWGIREAIADNPNTPAEILRTMGNEATEEEWRVRLTVARNPSTPTDALSILGNQKTESNWHVRGAVAQNPRTLMDTIRVLINDKTEFDWRVRRDIVTNPSVTTEILRTLADSSKELEWRVRKAVAENPNTPVEILRILSNPETEPELMVRREVAKNPSTPENILRFLGHPATESEAIIRHEAYMNLATRSLV